MRQAMYLSILLVLASMGPAAIPPVAVGHGASPGLDRMTITIDDPSKEAVVGGDTKAEMVFYGNVTVDAITGERIVVTLVPNVNQGWPSSVDPATMTIWNKNPVAFTAKVEVPEYSLACNIGNLTVNGTARGGGLVTYANATARITVRPFYRMMAEAEGGLSRKISPGGTAEFNLKVWNYGNAVDTMTISIANQNALEAKGWETRFNVTRLENVNAAEAGLVLLTVVPPKDNTPYKDEVMTITIKVESQGAIAQGNSTGYSRDVKVHVKGSSAANITWIVVVAIVVAAALVVVIRKIRRRRASPGNDTGGHSR